MLMDKSLYTVHNILYKAEFDCYVQHIKIFLSPIHEVTLINTVVSYINPFGWHGAICRNVLCCSHRKIHDIEPFLSIIYWATATSLLKKIIEGMRGCHLNFLDSSLMIVVFARNQIIMNFTRFETTRNDAYSAFRLY